MKKLLSAFAYACSGIQYCVLKENNFKIHLGAIPILIVLGFYFEIADYEWLIIAGCIGAVLCLEMMNTAIEKICNYMQPAIHPQIKLIKDISAGAVLVASILAVVCALIIFIPKF